MLRILVGENDAEPEFNRAAKRGASIGWIVPKASEPGDDALFLFNRSSFTGRGVIATSPSPAMLGRRSAFQAEVGNLELFERPVSLEAVAKRIPEWEWPSYPRSFTTPTMEIASKLLAVLNSDGPMTRASAVTASAQVSQRARVPQDPDAATRWNEMFPARHRESLARALSRSIVAAHALGDTCWTLTFGSNFVRLNVGVPLAFTAWDTGCNLIVMDDPALLRALSRAGLRVRRGQSFEKAPGTILLAFPLRSVAEVHALAWRSHLQAMEIAAAKQRVTPHRGYSAELVDHLRAMGSDVPHSNCPEAVALREERRRDGKPGASDDEHLAVEPFAPTSIEDGRRYTRASILRRQGQGAFRDALLRAYGLSCAVTGCDVMEVLEAAHIIPYRGDATNHVQNGILLRADLHVLFDMGLLDFDSAWRVRLDESLRNSAYGEFEGKPLRMPKEKSSRPSREALALRKESRT